MERKTRFDKEHLHSLGHIITLSYNGRWRSLVFVFGDDLALRNSAFEALRQTFAPDTHPTIPLFEQAYAQPRLNYSFEYDDLVFAPLVMEDWVVGVPCFYGTMLPQEIKNEINVMDPGATFGTWIEYQKPKRWVFRDYFGRDVHPDWYQEEN